MTAHTVTIKAIEEFVPDVTVTTLLGVETKMPASASTIRTTIDVDDTVVDHYHYFPVEAIATRMTLYDLATEREAIEALEREIVRMWDPLELPAPAEPRDVYGGADVGVTVVWATGVAKDADAVIAKCQDRLDRFRETQAPPEPAPEPAP
jgi:Arc/MetJ family transcription regulator